MQIRKYTWRLLVLGQCQELLVSAGAAVARNEDRLSADKFISDVSHNKMLNE